MLAYRKPYSGHLYWGIMMMTIDNHDHARSLMTTKLDDHDLHHLVSRTRSTITIIAMSYHDRRSRSMAAVYFSLRTTTIDDHDLQKWQMTTTIADLADRRPRPHDRQERSADRRPRPLQRPIKYPKKFHYREFSVGSSI